MDRPRTAQTAAASANGQAALPGIARSRRLHPSPPAQPPAGPDAGRLRVDRRAPQFGRHRAVRGREELSRVCIRRAGMPPRLHRALPPHAAPAARAGRRPRGRLLHAILQKLRKETAPCLHREGEEAASPSISRPPDGNRPKRTARRPRRTTVAEWVAVHRPFAPYGCPHVFRRAGQPIIGRATVAKRSNARS